METKTYRAGEVIFEEGQEASVMFILLSGAIELRKKSGDGEQLLKTVDQKNEVFGEMALIDGQPRSATALVSREAQVYEINHSAFEHLITTNGTFALKVIQILSERIRNSNRQISELVETDQRERFLYAMVNYARTHGERIFNGGLKINIEGLKTWVNSHIAMSEKEIDSHIFRLVKSNATPYAPSSAKTKEDIVLSPEFIASNERRKSGE